MNEFIKSSWKDKINTTGIINTTVDEYLESFGFKISKMVPEVVQGLMVVSWGKPALMLTILNYEGSDDKVTIYISGLELVYQNESQWGNLMSSRVVRLDSYFNKHRSKITKENIDYLMDEILI